MERQKQQKRSRTEMIDHRYNIKMMNNNKNDNNNNKNDNNNNNNDDNNNIIEGNVITNQKEEVYLI